MNKDYLFSMWGLNYLLFLHSFVCEGSPIEIEIENLNKTLHKLSTLLAMVLCKTSHAQDIYHYLHGMMLEFVFNHESIWWFANQKDFKG